MRFLCPVLMAVYALLICAPKAGSAQDAKQDDPDKARSEMLKRWGVSGLAKVGDVDTKATALLKLPLAEQSVENLEDLAKRANTVANLIGFILEEYNDYYRENYKYEFIQKRV